MNYKTNRYDGDQERQLKKIEEVNLDYGDQEYEAGTTDKGGLYYGEALQALHEIPLSVFQYKLEEGETDKLTYGVLVERIDQLLEHLMPIDSETKVPTGEMNTITHELFRGAVKEFDGVNNDTIKLNDQFYPDYTKPFKDKSEKEKYIARMNYYTYSEKEVESIVNYLGMILQSTGSHQDILSTVNIMLKGMQEAQERLLQLETSVYGWDSPTIPGNEKELNKNKYLPFSGQTPTVQGLNRLVRHMHKFIFDVEEDVEQLDQHHQGQTSFFNAYNLLYDLIGKETVSLTLKSNFGEEGVSNPSGMYVEDDTYEPGKYKTVNLELNKWLSKFCFYENIERSETEDGYLELNTYKRNEDNWSKFNKGKTEDVDRFSIEPSNLPKQEYHLIDFNNSLDGRTIRLETFRYIDILKDILTKLCGDLYEQEVPTKSPITIEKIGGLLSILSVNEYAVNNGTEKDPVRIEACENGNVSLSNIFSFITAENGPLDIKISDKNKLSLMSFEPENQDQSEADNPTTTHWSFKEYMLKELFDLERYSKDINTNEYFKIYLKTFTNNRNKQHWFEDLYNQENLLDLILIMCGAKEPSAKPGDLWYLDDLATTIGNKVWAKFFSKLSMAESGLDKSITMSEIEAMFLSIDYSCSVGADPSILTVSKDDKSVDIKFEDIGGQRCLSDDNDAFKAFLDSEQLATIQSRVATSGYVNVAYGSYNYTNEREVEPLSQRIRNLEYFADYLNQLLPKTYNRKESEAFKDRFENYKPSYNDSKTSSGNKSGADTYFNFRDMAFMSIAPHLGPIDDKDKLNEILKYLSDGTSPFYLTGEKRLKAGIKWSKATDSVIVEASSGIPEHSHMLDYKKLNTQKTFANFAGNKIITVEDIYTAGLSQDIVSIDASNPSNLVITNKRWYDPDVWSAYTES